MIIKKVNNERILNTRKLSKLLGILGGALLLFFVLNIIIAYIPRGEHVIKCDAETISINGINPDFVQGGYTFANGSSRSSDFARSGLYSSRVDPKSKYGITHILKDAEAGEQYSISVWRMGNRTTKSNLTVSIDDGKLFHKETSVPVTFEPSGWEMLILNITIPYNYQKEKINIYVYTNGMGPAYFDDLEIRRLNRHENLCYAGFLRLCFSASRIAN